jgi:hypothetical protein
MLIVDLLLGAAAVESWNAVTCKLSQNLNLQAIFGGPMKSETSRSRIGDGKQCSDPSDRKSSPSDVPSQCVTIVLG